PDLFVFACSRSHRHLLSFPTRRSSDLSGRYGDLRAAAGIVGTADLRLGDRVAPVLEAQVAASRQRFRGIRHGAPWTEPGEIPTRSEEHTSELQSRFDLVCRLLLEKKKK